MGKFVKLNCRETRANNIYEQCMHIPSNKGVYQYGSEYSTQFLFLHRQVANRFFFLLYEEIISL